MTQMRGVSERKTERHCFPWKTRSTPVVLYLKYSKDLSEARNKVDELFL